MIDLTLELNYQLNAGWLSPFVDGLKQGQLKARQCTACSRTSVPPTRSCICGSVEGCWTTLGGTASILKRTTGNDGDYALVRFDGSDTMSVVALETVCASATTGVIIPASGDLPQLILVTDTA